MKMNRPEGVGDSLGVGRLVAETTCMLLRGTPVARGDLVEVMQAFRDIALGANSRNPARVEAVLPAVVAAIRDADEARAIAGKARPQPRQERPRRWKPIAPTLAPPTPIQRLEAALKRSPIRLDDRCAMAVARASGKPVGKDKLERAQQIDNRIALTFGFDFGTAKFTAEFDVRDDLGSQAVAALMQMLDTRE